MNKTIAVTIIAHQTIQHRKSDNNIAPNDPLELQIHLEQNVFISFVVKNIGSFIVFQQPFGFTFRFF